MRNFLVSRIVRRFVAAEGESKRKRMVVMIGPPAAGKGFFLGEPEKVDDKDVAKGKAKPEDVGKAKKYKTESGEERDTTYGYKLPEMTKGLFKDEDIPPSPDYDESDRHLRKIQYNEAVKHYETLSKAHAQGKEAYDKAMSDMWYSTKDGKKVSLGASVPFDKFPDSPQKLHKQADKEFYVSMRGWHDDAKHHNKETGKSVERYKDQARHRFDDAVGETSENDKSSNMMIVDSAGEDIDAQDFKGQIERAKANGYEVSVIFLHPEKADTELSNLSRNRVQGKRMVDGADIDNWYERNEDALKAIQAAAPNNFLHYRKGPPDSDPAKAAEKRKKARDLMEGLKGMGAEERKKAEGEIGKVLYGSSSYELQKDTSYGQTLKGLPKKPEKNIATAVKEMNDEAAKRAKVAPEKGEGGHAEKEEPEKEHKAPPDEKKKPEKTRIKFLDEVGDKEVPNPTFKPSNGESASNPRKRKIRNLPWEHQKKFYQQWSHAKHAKIASNVAQRFRETVMQVNAADESKNESKGFLSGWVSGLASDLKKLDAGSYDVSVKATEDLVFVTLKGAEGDLSTYKKVKEKITDVMKDRAKKDKNAPDNLKPVISQSTKGDDMVITCDFDF